MHLISTIQRLIKLFYIMSKIPSVDLSNFLSSNNDLKRDFVKKTGKAFQEIGFLSLKGHFLSKNCSENLYNQIKKFFDLPKNIKKKYEFDGVKGQRGYTSYGKEHLLLVLIYLKLPPYHFL